MQLEYALFCPSKSPGETAWAVPSHCRSMLFIRLLSSCCFFHPPLTPHGCHEAQEQHHASHIVGPPQVRNSSSTPLIVGPPNGQNRRSVRARRDIRRGRCVGPVRDLNFRAQARA